MRKLAEFSARWLEGNVLGLVFTHRNIAGDLPLFCCRIPIGLPLRDGFFIDGDAMAFGGV
jgi:hypothetical protein